MRGRTFEHRPRGGSISRTEVRQGLGHGGFHGAAAGRIDTTAARRQSQDGTPSIARMVLTHQQPLLHKSLEDAGDCAGMNVQDRDQVSERLPVPSGGDVFAERHDMTLFRKAASLAFVLALGGCIAVTERSGDVAPEPGEVRFELAGPGGAALVVPVRVNGAGPFPFVLDTGATLTCVDETLARELKLPDAEGTVALGGGIRGLAPMRLVELDSVALGDAMVHDLRGCTIDLARMRTAGLDVRGLLGLNVLREYRLTVDFDRRIVRLDPPSEVGPGPTSG